MTIPAVYLLLATLTVALPVLVLVAAVVDLSRWVAGRVPAMALRILTYAWVYLVGEAWALIALGYAGLFGTSRSIELTYRFQQTWLDWNYSTLRLVFRLEFYVDGDIDAGPGPLILLSRHASLIDTMLPGRFVARPYGFRLRYILKKELLVDPALDIGGQRLPNYFVDRGGEARSELEAITRLASDLERNEAALIWPEGTRFSEEKRAKYVARLERKKDTLGRIASGFRNVLPPRPGGTLAILDGTDADVLVLAHRGLEGFARISDIWRGGLVGSRIHLRFWRHPRSTSPTGRQERTEWLFRVWSVVDEWVSSSLARA